MARLLMTVLVLSMLGACGGSHRKRCSNSSDSGAEYYDPGYYDPGYYDPGYYDDGSSDGGDSGDVSEEKTSHNSAGSTPSVAIEAVNYDQAPYVLYVLTVNSKGQWNKLYLPPLPAASPGNSSQSVQPFRLRPGPSYSLVLEDSGGRRLDSQVLDRSDAALPSKNSFSVVGGILIASQS